MIIFARLALIVPAMFPAAVAQAQPIVIADSGDSAWVLAASAIALFAALPGLALFHGRNRDGGHATAMFVSVAVASLAFAIIGYSLAFSEGSALIGDGANALLANMADLHISATVSDTVHALFQMSVAVFAVAIMVSSFAERVRIGWLAVFVTLWSLIVYAPVAHWIWGGGWLTELGVIDFAGGIVVQVAAGTSVLVVALLLGGGEHEELASDRRITFGGLWLVWIGWLGVIGGAALAAGDDAATAMLNAQFAASAAVLAGFAIGRERGPANYGFPVAALAGLAAISSGAGFVGPGGAIIIGVLGAIGGWVGSVLMRFLKIGTSASAFISSGCGGIIGALVFPIFVSPLFGGPGFDGSVRLATQGVAQVVAVLVVMLWSGVVTAIAALIVSMILPMRATSEGYYPRRSRFNSSEAACPDRGRVGQTS